MAFVYNQSRWNADKQKTPGPGYYISDQQVQKRKVKARPCTVNRIVKNSENHPPQILCLQNQKIIKRKQIKKCLTGTRNSRVFKQKQRNKGSDGDLQRSIKDLKIGKEKKYSHKLSHSFKSTLCIAPSRTVPSIKNVEKLNIFVGQDKVEQKKKSFKRKKTKSFQWNQYQRSKVNQQAINMINQQIRKLQKNFKKQSFEKEKKPEKQCEKHFDETQTGIQWQEEGQSEFIDNAIPGPGSYNIITKPKTTKKSLMFTNSVERFQKNKNINLEKDFYDKNEPNFKKSSKADQKRIAFGSSNNIIQKLQKKERENRHFEFYNDHQSIENKCLKMKLKAKSKKLFNEQVNEIDHIKQIDWAEELKDESKQPERKRRSKKYKIKGTSNFLSKTKRILNNTKNNSDHSKFYSQEYKTIMKDLQYNQKRNQNITNVGFMSKFCDNENDDKQENDNYRKKSYPEVKHGLIETKNGFRYRQTEKQKYVKPKGYSFRKSSSDIFGDQKIKFPSPYAYDTIKTWEKKSYNQNFKNLLI